MNKHRHKAGTGIMRTGTILVFVCVPAAVGAGPERDRDGWLRWSRLPDLPERLGVAGPFAGVHRGALLVAGGANFPEPVWEHEKVWHDAIYVLVRQAASWVWKDDGRIGRPLAYGASVSTPDGVVCMGGCDRHRVYADVFLLAWDPETQRVTRTEYPPLPQPCAYGQAALVGQVIYLAGLLTCLVTGYVASLLVPGPAGDLTGRTLATRRTRSREGREGAKIIRRGGPAAAG